MQVLLDRFAIILSGICAIHCILLPVAVSVIPLLAVTVQHGQQLHQFWFHQFILIFIVPVSVLALIAGFRSHRQWFPIGVSLIGLMILTTIALFASTLISLRIIPHQAEMLITISGGIIHAIGHILNLLATRKTSQPCIIKG